MLELAITVTGRDAEILDSYGEVLILMNDYKAAIRALETALSLNQNRPTTREKLARAYNSISMPEMADAVLKKGAEISSKQQTLIGQSSDSAAKPKAVEGENAQGSIGAKAPIPPTEPAQDSSSPAVLPNGLIKKDGLLPSPE